MFKESKEGQTHYFNDGCGEPAHNCAECQFENGKHSQKCSEYEQVNYTQVGDFHCFKCHRDFKDSLHGIDCKERVDENKDGGALSCGKLSGGNCEFMTNPLKDKSWENEMPMKVLLFSLEHLKEYPIDGNKTRFDKEIETIKNIIRQLVSDTKESTLAELKKDFIKSGARKNLIDFLNKFPVNTENVIDSAYLHGLESGKESTLREIEKATEKLEFEKVSEDGHSALISKPEILQIIRNKIKE